MTQHEDKTNHKTADKPSSIFSEGDWEYAELFGSRRQGRIKIVAYLALFLASFLVQARLSSTHNLTGVVAQLQVMISVFLVVSIPKIGYRVALSANAAEFLLLSGRILFLEDSRVLPGMFVCLCTMLTVTIISVFGRRLNRKHWELSHNKEKLSRLYQEVTEAGQRSAYLANHDELTGLANARNLRTRLTAHYGAAFPLVPKGSLAMIKLENFKVINSIFGPRTGDAVLQAVARRMQEFADQSGLHAARLESCTFALFSPQSVAMEGLLDQLIALLHEPLHLEGESLEVRLCAGYVECGEDADDAVTLYQCAELALTEARAAGCRAIGVYDSRMAREARRRLAIVAELEMALKREEFQLLYQPQIDVATGAVVGAEALIRWENARLGKVMPIEFIPLAEQNGQILAMGNWILERACQDASGWPEEWKVSVNVSTGQFFDRHFEAQIERALSDSGLSPARLKLEITESVLIGDDLSVVEILKRIRAQRVSISLDDFGTGYSSLSYLKNIPLDELKIDRSFVIAMEADSESKAIVETIVHLAGLLHLTTTAEGVETSSQAEILRDLGCDRFQGYLYGKPMPVQELLAMRDFRAS
jgi:diguanylate cyclase (GGDEF)-like protein